MVKKINWKDFEIKDLQPNLIPNGWDSFEPYGSGKNYVDNWDFESDDLRGFAGANAMEIYIQNNKLIGEVSGEGTLSASAILIQNIPNLPLGEYLFRAKIKSSNPSTRIYYRTRSDATDRKQEGFEIDKTDIVEFYFSRTVLDDFDIWVYANNPISAVNIGDKIEIDWIQITPVDNQHLVVEKTPLGNGLTRIQTWGGNHEMKLLCVKYNTQEVNKNYTYGLYVEKLNEKLFVQYNQGKFMIEGYNKETVIATSTTLNFQLRAARKQDNLDFIASDPQIVEGDKANPALIITELEDGREHVKIYGANVDTELVYKGGNAIIGEPYVIESEIENLGGQLQMETTLDSVGKVIDKGINQVSIRGTTDSKDFEIGVKLRDGTI